MAIAALGDGETPEELLETIESFFGGFCCVEVVVDGVPVENVDRYLLTTRPQVLAAPNLFVPEATLVVARGWYLLLRPMSVGQHTVSLADAYINGGRTDFSSTFHITVEPRRNGRRPNGDDDDDDRDRDDLETGEQRIVMPGQVPER